MLIKNEMESEHPKPQQQQIRSSIIDISAFNNNDQRPQPLVGQNFETNFISTETTNNVSPPDGSEESPSDAFQQSSIWVNDSIEFEVLN